jgi:hypothetical protein
LVVALMIEFTAVLAQLGRQSDRNTTAKSARQFYARWLARPDWDPAVIYAGLNRRARRHLAHRSTVPLLIDYTYLENQWAVLQVSCGWQRRALPLYRAVYRRTHPEVGQTESVRQACAVLRGHLPGPKTRYVLVMDRGFPGHGLLRALQEAGWRMTLRVNKEWLMTHPAYTGPLHAACHVPGLVTARPRWFGAAILGQRGKGKERWSRGHVVMFHGEGHQEPWFLVTTEPRAAAAVRIYRQRMHIECEFRDVKGPWGLDELASWQDRDRVARFLAMVAVYEWHLASLWGACRLRRWVARFTVHGKLSWIRLTREWLQYQLRLHSRLALDCL